MGSLSAEKKALASSDALSKTDGDWLKKGYHVLLYMTEDAETESRGEEWEHVCWAWAELEERLKERGYDDMVCSIPYHFYIILILIFYES